MVRSAYASSAISTLWFTLLAGLGGIIATRALGPFERGLLATAVVWSTVAGSVGAYGIPGVATYFTARDKDRPSRAAPTVLVIGFSVGLAMAALGVTTSVLIVDSDAAPALAVAFLSLVVVIPVGAALGALLGVGDVRGWGYMRVLGPALTLLGTIAVVLGDLRVAVAIAAVNGLAAATQLVLLLIIMKRRELLGRPARQLRRPIVSFGWRNVVAGSGWLVVSHLDQLALSVAVAPEELGIYAVAVSFGAIIYSIGASAGAVALQRIAGGGAAAARQVLRRGLVGAGLLAAGLCAATFASAGYVVPLVFGTTFEPAVAPLRILLFGTLALVLTSILSDVMRGLGQPLALASASMVGALVMLAGLPVALPLLGITGAATVSVASSSTMLLIMIRRVRRALRVQPFSPPGPSPVGPVEPPPPPI